MKLSIIFEPRSDLDPSALTTLFAMVQSIEKPEPELSEPEPSDDDLPEAEAPPAQPPHAVALQPAIIVPQPVVAVAGTAPVAAQVVTPAAPQPEPEPEDTGPEMPLQIPQGIDTTKPFEDSKGYWRMVDGRFFEATSQQWIMPQVEVRPQAPAAEATADKPKRTRRTKAQIEADKLAAATPQPQPVAQPQQQFAVPTMPQQMQPAMPMAQPQAAPMVAQPPVAIPQAQPMAPSAPVMQPQAPAMPAAPQQAAGDKYMPVLGADNCVTVESFRDVLRELNTLKTGVGFSAMKQFGVFMPEKVPAEQRLAVLSKARELAGMPGFA